MEAIIERAQPCPSCGRAMVKDLNPGDWWACVDCRVPVEIAPPGRQVALKLPGIDRGPQRRRIVEREETIQQRIIEALVQRHCEVMVTTRRYKVIICRQCRAKNWPSGGDGVSKGLGDLLVWHPSWPPTTRIEADVKGSRTPLSPEQKVRVAAGVLRIWRSVADAIRDVGEMMRSDTRRRA